MLFLCRKALLQAPYSTLSCLLLSYLKYERADRSVFVRKPGATSPYCVCYCSDGFFLTYNIFGQRFFKAGEPLRCIIAVIPYGDTGILCYHIGYIVCCKGRSISAVICTERFFLLSEFQRKCEILIVYSPYFSSDSSFSFLPMLSSPLRLSLILAEPSSIRSIALSGRKRSFIYLTDRPTAAEIASSVIFTL